MSQNHYTEAITFCRDAILPQRKVHLESAEINRAGRLQVTIDGEILQYPVDWLRRNCQCAKCFNSDTHGFMSPFEHTFGQENSLQSVSKIEEGVRCMFDDDHQVVFSPVWLYNRRMTEEGSKERQSHMFPQNFVPWPKPEDMVVEKVDYNEVIYTSAGYIEFVNALTKDGLCVITGSPADRFLSAEFAECTGLQPSVNPFTGSNQNYSVIKADPSTTDLAFETSSLDLHVDLCYLKRTLDILILHCMVQSNIGGENVLTDAIKAALILRERYPDHFSVLTSQKVQNEDLYSQSFLANLLPTIQLDENGEPIKVVLSNHFHSSFFPGTVDEYEAYIKALKEYHSILCECSITFKSEPGDMIVMDNHRMIHGRLGYPSSEERQLELWYIDWDSVLSKFRVQKIKQHQALIASSLPLNGFEESDSISRR